MGLCCSEGPPSGRVAEGKVAEQFGVDVDGEAHGLDDGLADGVVGLARRPQFEQVVTLAETHPG